MSEDARNRAGAMLAAARRASGLSIDAVAQQLKLSPRQVRALEDGDYDLLPGRTFVRGFVRNYARLVKLDPEQVQDALPSANGSPTLEAPTLHPTAPSMGEMPTAEKSRAPWTRWAIPVSLAAVVAVAAVYEWARPAAASRPHAQAREAGAAAAVPSPAAEKNETPLPNPVAGNAAPVPSKDGTAPSDPASTHAATPSPAEAAQTKSAPHAH